MRDSREKLTPATLEAIRMAGQGLYTFLIEKAKVAESNPFKEAGPVSTPKRVPLYFDVNMLPRLFAELKPHHRAVSLFSVATGMRKGEVLGAKKEDVHLVERFIVIRRSGHRESTKSNRDRLVPIPEALVSLIESQLKTPGMWLFPKQNGKRWSVGWALHRVIERACARAGLPANLRFKDLRSSWATHAYLVTGDIRLVQAGLGHQDSRTTERYVFMVSEHLRKGANAVAEMTLPKGK